MPDLCIHPIQRRISLGCRRIAFIGASHKDDAEPRLATYRTVMSEAGRILEIIFTAHHSRPEAHAAMQEHLTDCGCPDGLFCFNDDVALCAYRALRDRGIRVPDDIALIGHDGMEDAEYRDCPLTTFVHPVREMTELAWRYLRQRTVPSVPTRSRSVTYGQLKTISPGTSIMSQRFLKGIYLGFRVVSLYPDAQPPQRRLPLPAEALSWN